MYLNPDTVNWFTEYRPTCQNMSSFITRKSFFRYFKKADGATEAQKRRFND